MSSAFRIFVGPLALTSFLAVAACSGAKAQLVDEAPAETSTAEPPAADSDAGGGAAASSGTGSAASGGSDSGSGSSGGSGSGGGPSVGAPAPTQCPAGAITEDGSNGAQYTAMEMATAACGTVSANGTDWWRFTLPAKATQLAVEYAGKVSLQVTSGGGTYTVGAGAPLPFHPGAEYFIEVDSSTGSSQSYVIAVEEE